MIPAHLLPTETYTGAIDPGFLFPDGLRLGDMPSQRAISEADRPRLVKGTKSPTAIYQPDKWVGSPLPEAIEPLRPAATPEGQRGAYAVIQFREWSDEYRIRPRVETTAGTLPPDNSGERITDVLSSRALRTIADSCCYVGKHCGGYRTFLTLTFTDEQRARIEDGETTVQREVSRFCDGLQKLWARGWKAEFTVHGRKIACIDNNGEAQGEEPHTSDLLYCWVAEVPDNAVGEPNPHVHMMLNWRVKYGLFPAWAKRIEKLWGCGFAHLEKIKDGDAAASYMLKAAGYLCKAQGKEDQGRIRGNRYGLSAAARAPGWVTLEEKQLHIMGRLIADVHDHLTTKYDEQYTARKQLKKSLDAAPKGHRVRRAIGRQLERVRKFLADEVPAVASKYQLIIRGKTAFYEFMAWAKSPGHWQAHCADWLPEKWPGENWRPGQRPDSQWFARFKDVHYWRRALRHQPRVWSDWEFNQALGDYQQYEQLAA